LIQVIYFNIIASIYSFRNRCWMDNRIPLKCEHEEPERPHHKCHEEG